MTDQSVEERLQKLEEDNKKMKLEIDRAQAINEIRNLLGTLQAWHAVGMDAKIGTLFANRDDTRVYFGELGAFEGPDASDRAGAGLAGMDHTGHMAIHMMVNPVIQVAGDGQTAQAIFIAAGIVAGKDRETGKPRAMWEWNRYGDDFIKEDGKWKIWHHHVYPLFQVGWDDEWADQFKPKTGEHPLPFKPDVPAGPLDVFYSPDEELPLIPIPEPYETFDPKQMY